MSYYRITNEVVKKNCLKEIEGLYGQWEVAIRKPKRSNNQNSYWHKLVEIISRFTGDDPEDMKLRLKYEFLPLKEIQVNGKNHLYPKSTAELTKEEFSPLIEKTLMLGHSLGLVMPLASHYGLDPGPGSVVGATPGITPTRTGIGGE